MQKPFNLDSLQIPFTWFENALKDYYKDKILNQLEYIRSNNTGKLRFYSKICSSFKFKIYLKFDLSKFDKSLNYLYVFVLYNMCNVSICNILYAVPAFGIKLLLLLLLLL